MKLTSSDQHCLRAAQGWLELGNHKEAAAELEGISPEARKHPAVLELRWAIFARANAWAACVDIAKSQTAVAPDSASSWINLAYALHELRRTKEAFDTLMPKFERFPSVWIIPYNLACYTCQLGDLIGARDWLAQAIKLGNAKEVQAQALEDTDLAPLWGETLE